jgi:hypothetical protein
MESVTTQRAKPLQQFAKERSISMPTVYRRIAAGELIAHKIGSRTFVLTEHEAAFDAALRQLPARKAGQ